MKVNNLVRILELEMGSKDVTKVLTSLSHWVNAIFQAKKYIVGNSKDIEILKRLETLRIVSLKEKSGNTIATLTKEGMQLYQDFYGHGYYL